MPRDLTGFVEHLAEARIGSTFNFYRDGAGAVVRRARLVAYLDERRGGMSFLSERRQAIAGRA